MISSYTPEVHTRCKTWANWLTDSKRSLVHRAALARFIRSYPDLRGQVEMLISIKLSIEALNRVAKLR